LTSRRPSHRNERTLTLLQATRGRDPYNVIGEFGGGGLVMCACEVGVVVDVVLVGVVPSSVLPAVVCQTCAYGGQTCAGVSRPGCPIFNSGLACHVLILRVRSWALIHGCCLHFSGRSSLPLRRRPPPASLVLVRWLPPLLPRSCAQSRRCLRSPRRYFHLLVVLSSLGS
jgi:hypothetical protein